MEEKRHILICVDDTDDVTKETSTGKIADMIAAAICGKGAEMIRGITRHQLLLDDEIEYTSHNSSMCMEIMTELSLEKLEEVAAAELKAEMSVVSDPGLCFCILDELKNPDALIAYGKRAQNEIITKDMAYETASEVGGTYLFEYGGSGIGIIGALAGVGLRISGNDGTIRGNKGEKLAGQTLTVEEWKNHMGIEMVIDFDGKELDDNVEVTNKSKLKLAYFDHKITLVARQNKKGEYIACKKKDLYENDKPIIRWHQPCDKFEEDNDLGECYSDGEIACWNCLYRRWTADGYRCVAEKNES